LTSIYIDYLFLMKNKKKDEKHKLIGECFNKCVEWKLNTSITINKTTYGYVLFT